MSDHQHVFEAYDICRACGQTEAAATNDCHHCDDATSKENGRCWWCLRELASRQTEAPQEAREKLAERLEALEKIATEQPWRSARPSAAAKRLKSEAVALYGPDCLIYSMPRNYACLPQTFYRQCADAQLIIELRNHLPEILAALRGCGGQTRELVERLEREIADMEHVARNSGGLNHNGLRKIALFKDCLAALRGQAQE